MDLLWSDVVASSDLGPAVFDVLPPHQRRVRDWATARALPAAVQREVHAPTVQGWAMLDGGITAVSGYDLTTLPHGVRVIGFGVLRLLLADLGATTPDEPFPGEDPVDIDDLRRRHQSTPPDDPAAREQAELLAVCRDAVLLRWVAATLAAEHASRTVERIR